MDKILSPDSRILLDYILLFFREEVFSKSSFVNMLLYSFDFLGDISNLYNPFIYIFFYKGSSDTKLYRPSTYWFSIDVSFRIPLTSYQ